MSLTKILRDTGRPAQKRIIRFSPASIAPIIGFLLSRVLFLGVNQAEFTDGYQLITWSIENPVRWHPLYPVLLKPLSWIIDPVIAGRVLSILSGLGAMLAIHKITKTLYGQRAAILAMWMYVVSPLFFWTNLRVLTESTFQMFFFWSIYYLLLFAGSEKRSAGPLFLLLSGLSYLTRPEGVILAPLVVVVLWMSRCRPYLANAGAMIPWLLALAWSFVLRSSDRYADIVVSSLPHFEWDLAITRLLSYVDVYPYIIFYPFFAFAIWNMLSNSHSREWKRLLVYVHLVFAAMLFIHPTWTTRLLFIPISFAVVEASAGLARSRTRVAVILLAACMVFSVSALLLQKQMFSDFKDSALAVKSEFSNRRIVSDEQAKSEYYLQKRIVMYEKQNLLPGDILLLHSYNTDLTEEKKFLDSNYRYTPLLSAESSIVPLLGNAALADSNFTNSTVAFIQRFEVQRFQSVVVRIDARK